MKQWARTYAANDRLWLLLLLVISMGCGRWGIDTLSPGRASPRDASTLGPTDTGTTTPPTEEDAGADGGEVDAQAGDGGLDAGTGPTDASISCTTGAPSIQILEPANNMEFAGQTNSRVTAVWRATGATGDVRVQLTGPGAPAFDEVVPACSLSLFVGSIGDCVCTLVISFVDSPSIRDSVNFTVTSD